MFWTKNTSTNFLKQNSSSRHTVVRIQLFSNNNSDTTWNCMQYLEIPTVPKLFKIPKFEVLTAKRRRPPPRLAMHLLHHLKVGGGRKATPTTPCTILRAENLPSLSWNLSMCRSLTNVESNFWCWRRGGGGRSTPSIILKHTKSYRSKTMGDKASSECELFEKWSGSF